jgi:hypothetical protein
MPRATAVRLPAAVHGGLMAHRLLLPARSLLAGGCGVSRFSHMVFLCWPGAQMNGLLIRGQGLHISSPQVRGLRLRGVAPRSRFRVCALLPSVLSDAVGSPEHPISELNTQPTDTPVQRFKCSLTTALTWLGARVVRYSFPVRLFHSLLHAGLSRRYPDQGVCPTIAPEYPVSGKLSDIELSSWGPRIVR